MKPGLLIVALAALALSLPVAAQLEPGSEPVSLGPIGGSAVSVVTHPNDPDEVLVIKFTLGIFRSTDGGDTFGLQPYGTGISGNVRDLTQDSSDPDTLYVMDGNQVFKSTDFGASWSPLSLVGIYTDLKSLAVAPTGDDLLALDAFNAYRSDDGGATWTAVLQVVPFSGAVLDSVVFSLADASVAYVAHSNGIYRSDDAGASFADTGPFDEWVDGIATSPTDADTVFAGTNFNGLFKSTDGGVTVSSIGPPGNAQWLSSEPDGLWYGTLQSVDYSPDGGDTWTAVTAGWPQLTPIPAVITTASNGVRYLGCESNSFFADQTGGGLYRMPAGPVGAWDHIAFLASPIPDVAVVSPGGLRIIGFGNGVYSGAPGETVEATDLFLIDTRAVAIDPDDSTRWLAGGVGSFGDNAQVHVISDNGDSFVRTYERFGAGVVQDIEFDPFDSNRLLAGIFPGGFGNAAIIRSTNDGASWTDVPGTAGWATRALAFDPFVPGGVIQLSDNNQWAASINSGTSWSALQPAWPATGPAVLLAFDPFVPGALYRGDAGTGLWRSEDQGGSWTALGVGLHSSSDILLHPEMPGWLWVSDDQGRVLVSTDRGSTFQVALDIPQGSNGSHMALDTSDGSLLVGTSGASTWELAGASPVLKLGDGTEGSGALVPRHYPAGGLPQIGNASYGLAGDGIVGGATVFFALGLSVTDVNAYGGTFYVGDIVVLPSFVVGGTPGSPGEGDFVAPLPIPNIPAAAGLQIVTQYAVVDPGAPHISGIALSDGLSTTLHN